ncbi:MAG: hypothetical protein J6K17_09370 [Oscillospiraceae bacterium]|nr:hypothetical protein [Oscillospiraceae bacterium]
MKLVEKIKSFIPNSNESWLRLSISFFITGILFLLFDFIAINNISTDNQSTITLVSSIFMYAGIFCFPYINNKDKIFLAIGNFLFYLIYLIITVLAVLQWLSSASNGNVNFWLSIIVAVMLTILLNVTLKPLFFIIKTINQKICDISLKNQDGRITKGFKELFANIGIITAFIISILTIIKTIVEIASGV